MSGSHILGVFDARATPLQPNKIFLVNSGCGLADREETAESERDLYDAGYVKVEFLRYEWRRWAWPGGYPIFYICADGGVLCSKCANKEIKLTSDSEIDRQWQIVDADINYEDNDLFCDHCGERCEAAYCESNDNDIEAAHSSAYPGATT